MSNKGRKGICLVIMTVCLCWSGHAGGYVLCPDHILTRMLKKTAPSAGVEVSQKTSLRDFDCGGVAGPEGRITAETLWYAPPGRIRLEASGPDDRQIYVADETGALTIVGQKIVADRPSDLLAYLLPLSFTSRERLIKGLERYGVDTQVSSLGRYQREVAFVIGARFPDTSASQLWVDKETFLPTRLLIRKPGQDRLLETRYLDWQQVRSLWYPMRVEVYQNGLLSRVVCADAVSGKSSFPPDFFDITALKNEYPQNIPPAADEPEAPRSETDIQQTIDDFRKLYQ